MKTKVALIFGITGQDGSYLAQLLLKKKYRVHGVVRKNYKKNALKNNWRINHLKKKLTLHKVNILNFNELERLIKKVRPNEVYHLAAQPIAYLSPSYSFKNDFNTFKSNFNFTHILLSAVYKVNKDTKSKYRKIINIQFVDTDREELEFTISKYGEAYIFNYNFSSLKNFFDRDDYDNNTNHFRVKGVSYDNEWNVYDDYNIDIIGVIK